jgi:serine/threonine protein phosphatase PrpC
MATVDFSQLTETGPVRPGNEDSIGHWPHEDGLLFAVADGLGGHAAGEVASALALEVLAREMERAPGSWAVGKRLRRSAQEANLALHGKALAVPELSGMATTLTATVVLGPTLTTVHIGDTRLYLARGDTVTQLTKDHTWVAEQMQYGLLSAQMARTHPRRGSLTRSLGTELIVGIDVLSLTLEPGDVLVQCSDGVHGLLEDAEIAAIARMEPPADACRRLVDRAIEAGSRDNLSVQVAVVTDCPPAPAARPWWRFGR